MVIVDLIIQRLRLDKVTSRLAIARPWYEPVSPQSLNIQINNNQISQFTSFMYDLRSIILLVNLPIIEPELSYCIELALLEHNRYSYNSMLLKQCLKPVRGLRTADFDILEQHCSHFAQALLKKLCCQNKVFVYMQDAPSDEQQFCADFKKHCDTWNMAAIVRIKRRRDQDPAESLLISCKRKKLDEAETPLIQNVFKFAGTVSSSVCKWLSDTLSVLVNSVFSSETNINMVTV